ncbi:hypothetical protein SBRY_30137 [Actinacidiphila bryophytorum]|uniref:Uncharacterized protein n=1 Tax=Actinacidiphila bryophytorum TaxID=1436133 RepID=A0A9W4H0F8_9ACTN|nr:hypothetical protein SBRY_30137 [Actinacidiphila bryophytorum]
MGRAPSQVERPEQRPRSYSSGGARRCGWWVVQEPAEAGRWSRRGTSRADRLFDSGRRQPDIQFSRNERFHGAPFTGPSGRLARQREGLPHNWCAPEGWHLVRTRVKRFALATCFARLAVHLQNTAAERLSVANSP